ncbi:Thiamine-phosphate synthase [Entomobacter blattae]|uniref:Thiamine-phosphate synthase n=1 Tax=Entomobacter blattae TaxID=2762277 RepID=A0A7H1NRF6_9PROT|nr:Thiamine-phosphate synthase [Entomobacter blattae]
MSAFSLPPFYPVVDSAQWVERLVPTGVKLIQLRMKDKPLAIMQQQAAQALALCQRYAAQLVLNDYWPIAITLKIPFVHLGQEDLQTADIQALKHHNIAIGVSTHDHAELEKALAISPDYVALGPIFPTTSKIMAFGPQGIARITEWKKHVGPLPLVAIGGIACEQAAACLKAGADSVAAISDITQNPSPEERAREWLKATQLVDKPALSLPPQQGLDSRPNPSAESSSAVHASPEQSGSEQSDSGHNDSGHNDSGHGDFGHNDSRQEIRSNPNEPPNSPLSHGAHQKHLTP